MAAVGAGTVKMRQFKNTAVKLTAMYPLQLTWLVRHLLKSGEKHIMVRKTVQIRLVRVLA